MGNVVERILNLLAFLLTAGHPVTANEIRNTVAGYGQEEDAAFRRMFERDKNVLRSLGIPLELRPTDVWEVEFGYEVSPNEYALPDPGLSDEERAALWLASQAVRVGGRAPGPAALFKLGGMPMDAGGEPLAADLGADLDALAVVFAAVSDRRRLSFSYRERARTIDPYGLLHRRGHWYFAGREHESDSVKAYRVDRGSGYHAGDRSGAFDVPPGFDTSAVVPESGWQAGPEEFTARIAFDAEVAWWARRQLPAGTPLEEESDGGFVATLRGSNPDALIGWVLAFEDGAEILEPENLRERLVSLVRAAGKGAAP
jgi:predicted DNA-binding transcriptional regulator YafY